MIRRTLGISESLHLRPLVYAAESPGSPWAVHWDMPAQLSILLSQRIPPFEAGCAFLSPIDYARHGGDYRIIPGISASSRTPSRTIQLLLHQNLRSMDRVAVDVRVTSEIVLLKILLVEKFRELSSRDKGPEFVSVAGSVQEQLAKADAVLVVNLRSEPPLPSEFFALDLVEEWVDLTDLPYPHGFWVGHEDALDASVVRGLADACSFGRSHVASIARAVGASTGSNPQEILDYLSGFVYDLDEEIQDAASEFIRYAYYHGILRDIPELKFAGLEGP